MISLTVYECPPKGQYLPLTLLFLTSEPKVAHEWHPKLVDSGIRQVKSAWIRQDAQALCAHQVFDLILLDIEAADIWRDDNSSLHEMLFSTDTISSKRSSDVTLPPIIGLVHTLEGAQQYQAIAWELDDILTAPLVPAEIRYRLWRACQQKRHRERLNQQTCAMERLLTKRSRALKKQTQYDPITHLPNRHYLLAILRRQALSGLGAGVMFLVLDSLKDAVSLHGYRFTDRLLRLLADQVAQCLTPEQSIGVWGSHELVIVTTPHNENMVSELARRVMACFDHEQTLDDIPLTVKAQMGVSQANGYFDAERLVQQAALALPNSGSGSRWQYYHRDHALRSQRQASLLKALRSALSHKGFTLVYQPQVALLSGKVTSAEVLLRWNDPVHGAVSPDEFIPLSERSGDILAIGDWVLETAILQLAEWISMGSLDQEFHLAVNVAARQLTQSDFATRVLS
ncbi:EAL domain-containing protein [Halomonas alkaliantarctica]|nr:EAL domain-containing protein [Halomonas alkaliantarctica]